jgi:hypothetical protein
MVEVLSLLLATLTMTLSSSSEALVAQNVCGKNTLNVTMKRDEKDPTVLLIICPNGSVGLRIKGACAGQRAKLSKTSAGNYTISCV